MKQHSIPQARDHVTVAARDASVLDAALQVECPLCCAGIGERCIAKTHLTVHLSRKILWEKLQAQARAQEAQPLAVDNVDAVMARAEVVEPWFRGGWWWATVPGVIGPELADDELAALRQLRRRVVEEWPRVCAAVHRLALRQAEGRAA